MIKKCVRLCTVILSWQWVLYILQAWDSIYSIIAISVTPQTRIHQTLSYAAYQDGDWGYGCWGCLNELKLGHITEIILYFTLSVRIEADCVAHSCQVTRKLKRLPAGKGRGYNLWNCYYPGYDFYHSSLLKPVIQLLFYIILL